MLVQLLLVLATTTTATATTATAVIMIVVVIVIRDKSYTTMYKSLGRYTNDYDMKYAGAYKSR